MFSLDELFYVLDELSPITLSKKMISIGEYDNSGIIVNNHQNVEKILFALDLSVETVKKAKRLKCDTIVTHHPAIYYPIKNLSSIDAMVSPILFATESKMNVISMHLNLDIAEDGIDQNLAVGLGARKFKILDYLDENHGYGREFEIKEKSFSEYVKCIKKEFNTSKIVSYGKGTVKKVASFCGGGASHAEKEVIEKGISADTIVTSDMPHHTIKYLLDSGKKIIILPHYVAEEYGFKKYCNNCLSRINGKAEVYYFDDKRFR